MGECACQPFTGTKRVIVVSACRYEQAAALLGDMEAQHGVRPDEFSFAGLCVALQRESDLGGRQIIAEAQRIEAAIANCGGATSSLLALQSVHVLDDCTSAHLFDAFRGGLLPMPHTPAR
jgi:hypothetical protein